MREIIYGVWNSRKIVHADQIEGNSIDSIAEFNTSNPIDAIVSNIGFLVFNDKLNLRLLLSNYYRTVRENSCGKCTPCRMGSLLIDQALSSEATPDWDEVLCVARQMQVSSLCGIGKTSPAAIIGAIEYFRDKLDSTKGEAPKDTYTVSTARCIEACPSHVNIPRYIDYIKDGNPTHAAGVLLNHYPMVATCGRVCERPCEAACRRNALEGAVSIKDLKRYSVDNAGQSIASFFSEADISRNLTSPVAVIGAGPAGINCAYHLLQAGYPVTVFESDSKMGGMALRGIPSYRLPKDILKNETDAIINLGGKVIYGQKLGRDFSIADLKAQGCKAIFVGIGCAKGAYLGLPNEDTSTEGYRNGIDFLLDIQSHTEVGEKPVIEGDVVVVGCGNVAMDCCRVARRVATGKVHLVYRRSINEAPADRAEIDDAMAEGVQFHFLTNPTELLTENGKLTGVRLTKMQLTERDSRGRLGVKPIEGSEFDLPCQTLIAAIGQQIEAGVLDKQGLTLGRKGTITVNETQATTLEGVFAGGDCATGPSSLINALAAGERAAKSIIAYLEGKTRFNPRDRMSAIIASLGLVGDCEVENLKPLKRIPIRLEQASQRITNFDAVDFTYSDTEAYTEASRCMRCYRVVSIATAENVPNKPTRG